MVGKLIIEILILWILYALYMAILVHKRGPLGGIFFYPKVMQERVIEIGLMTEKELKRGRSTGISYSGCGLQRTVCRQRNALYLPRRRGGEDYPLFTGTGYSLCRPGIRSVHGW